MRDDDVTNPISTASALSGPGKPLTALPGFKRKQNSFEIHPYLHTLVCPGFPCAKWRVKRGGPFRFVPWIANIGRLVQAHWCSL